MAEHDPHGKQPHEPGAKLDAGKNRLGLVLGGFSLALQEVGKVGTYGAQKYSDNAAGYPFLLASQDTWMHCSGTYWHRKNAIQIPACYMLHTQPGTLWRCWN